MSNKNLSIIGLKARFKTVLNCAITRVYSKENAWVQLLHMRRKYTLDALFWRYARQQILVKPNRYTPARRLLDACFAFKLNRALVALTTKRANSRQFRALADVFIR